jgi:hypothetical protein
LTPTNVNLDTTWRCVESSPWDSRFITVPCTVTDTNSIPKLLSLEVDSRVKNMAVLDFFMESGEWK